MGSRLSSLVWRRVLPALLGLALAPSTAQQLTPRAYWPAPTGSKVALFGYSYGSGDVLTIFDQLLLSYLYAWR